MNSLSELHGRANAHARAARHLLAEKGSTRWSSHEQSVFDAHADEVERAREGIEIFMRKDSSRFSDSERVKVSNAMSTTTGSQGGYTVAPQVAQDVLSLLKGYGWMRQVAGQITTSSGEDQTFPTSDGTSETGEMLAQNAAATSLDPSFGAVVIPTYRFSSKVITVPFELLQDSATDIVSFVFRRARERIGRIQNAKFTVGVGGTTEPAGLVTASSVGKTGSTGQTTTIIYDDLVELADSVDEAQLGMPDSQPDMPVAAVGWMMHQSMRKVVRKLKDTNGRPIWMPGHVDGKKVSPALLLDYPVFINNDMAAPAANAKSLAFGNLGSYLVRDVADVQMFRMTDSAFTLKGQVGFIVYARAGGSLMDSGAVKLYQHSAT